MDPKELDAALVRLDGETAEQLESETLEFKSWDARQSRGDFLRNVREAVVGFANAAGGALVLGVADRVRTRADAIHGVGDLDLGRLRREIYDGTAPPITVEIEERHEPEGRLVVVRIPRGFPPQTTTDGTARIRVGNETKPLTGPSLIELIRRPGEYDSTASLVPGLAPGDLDSGEIERLRRAIRRNSGSAELLDLQDIELLEALGLTARDDVTLAALLLVGRPADIARFASSHEVAFMRHISNTDFDRSRHWKQALLAVIESVEQLFDNILPVTTVQTRGVQELEIPAVSWDVTREALINALIHRDYRLLQRVRLDLYPDRLEITSPGGFFGGVGPDNVLRHPPVRRNALLAGVFQTLGFINQAGIGVDRMFRDLLAAGKDLPTFRSDETYVTLVIPTITNRRFARFVHHQNRDDLNLELDDLIVLWGVAQRGEADRWYAAQILQREEAEAAARLVSLRERGYLEPRGRGRGAGYYFADPFKTLRLSPRSRSVDREAIRDLILDTLSTQGRLTNRELRRLTGYSAVRVQRLMKTLRDEGLVELRGRARSSHYVRADDGGYPVASPEHEQTSE